MASRNLSLDILRIFACFAVVMIHTAGSPICHGWVERGSSGFYQCMVLDGLSRWSVPVFAMLTGFFLLDPLKELSLKKLLTKYVLRIVCALVVWSLFYAITLHKPLYPFGTQEGHFWYLGMLICLYLTLPVLRIIAANGAVLKYFCIGWFVLMSYKFLGNFAQLPFALTTEIFTDYAGYCLCAYYLKSSSILKNRRSELTIYVLGILGVIVTIVFAVLSGDDDSVFLSYLSPSVILTALALFAFAVKHPVKLGGRGAAFVETLSKCTFGIYLVHVWILIYTLSRIRRFIPQPLPLVLIGVSVAFVAGFFIAWIIKKVPVINKYIV